MKEASKKNKIKIEAETNSKPKIPKELKSIEKKTKMDLYVKALEDLSFEINNAYFRTPYNRCPNCNKGFNNVLAYFGCNGSDTIGNLKGFNATINDIIAWSSQTYKGLSIVESKNNGVFKIATKPFNTPRKEPAVIERLVLPSMYRQVVEEMVAYLEEEKKDEDMDMSKIGKGEYPSAIKRKLQNT